MKYLLGIDLGGTKIEAIALGQNSEIIARQRVATPQGDYVATLNAIQALVADIERRVGNKSDRIGLGVPGAVSPATGLIKNANSTCLIGKPLDKDLQTLLQRPIKLANDADCFTLSEAIDGNAKAYKTVFGIILGTGVGGGIVINKNLVSGPNAISGEWGHNPLPWLETSDKPGRHCYCGKYDCIETFLSGPGFANHYNMLCDDKTNATQISAQEIWLRAEQGEELAKQCCNLYLEQLAKALSTVINILDPEVIVFGGGLSNQTALYSELPKRLGRYVFSDTVLTKIVQAKYGDSSGVRGAAWL